MIHCLPAWATYYCNTRTYSVYQVDLKRGPSEKLGASPIRQNLPYLAPGAVGGGVVAGDRLKTHFLKQL